MNTLDSSIFYQKMAFDCIHASTLVEDEKLRVIANMLRHNIVTQVMVANTGHIGTSLSGVDALTALYHGDIMNVDSIHPNVLDRDVFIMSKGHAAPLNYAVLASCGFFSDEKLLTLRRLHGLQGHVDMVVPGIDANTGSLAMGISKAKGYAFAMRRRHSSCRAFVMVGDGELQEGQNWEAIASAPGMKLGNVVLLLDQNLVQTDTLVEKIMPMPPVEEKLRAFGWEVIVVEQGNNAAEIKKILSSVDTSNAIPKAIILKTIKGAGVSFMEHPAAIAKDGMYHWHNKVPNQEQYVQAAQELKDKISKDLHTILVPENFWPTVPSEFSRVSTPWVDDYVVRGYTKSLLSLVESHPEIVVLDGDLAIDCGIREIEEKKPEHFLQCGIAEQDIASMAGAMSHQGVLPIVNTFSAFLSSRANEEIFNAQSEHGKVIYVGHLAGLIPSTPGKSHQAVRDIGLIRTIPEIAICEPGTEKEAEDMTKFLVEVLPKSAYMRLANCKGLRDVSLPLEYQVQLGRGWIARDGSTLAYITAGPVMLAQVMNAADIVSCDMHFEAKVIHLSWHTDIDADWLATALQDVQKIIVVNNHVMQGSQAEALQALFARDERFSHIKCVALSVVGFAETGQPQEVLEHFGLDAESIAKISNIQ